MCRITTSPNIALFAVVVEIYSLKFFFKEVLHLFGWHTIGAILILCTETKISHLLTKDHSNVSSL